MKNTRNLITALSLVALANITTACSQHSARQEDSGTVTTLDSIAPDSRLARMVRMHFNNFVSTNLQSLIDARYTSAQCSDEIVSSMINANQGSQLNVILRDGVGSATKGLAVDQILEKSLDSYCQVSALADIAKEASKKYINPAHAERISDAEHSNMMDQANLIYSVLNPKMKDIKTKIAITESYAEKVERHESLSSRIETALSTISSQSSVLSTFCDGPNCIEEDIISRSQRQVQEISGHLSDYALSAADQNIDSKIRALEGQLAELSAVGNQLNLLVNARLTRGSGEDSTQAGTVPTTRENPHL